jgi:hypothetical protein
MAKPAKRKPGQTVRRGTVKRGIGSLFGNSDYPAPPKAPRKKPKQKPAGKSAK